MMVIAFAVVTALSAAAILFVKEVFHAAMLLIICLLCVAGIFVTFDAEFLAVVQLLVYAAGVLLLIVFGIMLTVRSNDHSIGMSNNKVISVIIGSSLFLIMVYSLKELPIANVNPDLSPETIGILLMTNYAIPFELAGFLLLISLIGAIVAATNLKKD
jgi:NADH:ubiquinone oxidoreductase subunit 6 (subunit J)